MSDFDNYSGKLCPLLRDPCLQLLAGRNGFDQRSDQILFPFLDRGHCSPKPMKETAAERVSGFTSQSDDVSGCFHIWCHWLIHLNGFIFRQFYSLFGKTIRKSCATLTHSFPFLLFAWRKTKTSVKSSQYIISWFDSWTEASKHCFHLGCC